MASGEISQLLTQERIEDTVQYVNLLFVDSFLKDYFSERSQSVADNGVRLAYKLVVCMEYLV